MKANRISGFPTLTLALAALLIAPCANAQRIKDKDRISAFTALQQVSDRFGDNVTASIVELRGSQGQSQPVDWDMIVYDRTSPYLVSEYSMSGKAKPIDKGPYRDLYPSYVPDGFIKREKLQIDSTAAFRILNTEASRAGVGFDSVNYHLRCREFSEEPLWRLSALDIDGYRVGHLDISGATGEVLRTVWFMYDERHRNPPRIVDSNLIGGPGIPIEQEPIPNLIEIGVSTPIAPEPAPAPEFPNSNPTENLRPFTPAPMPAPGPPIAVVEPVGGSPTVALPNTTAEIPSHPTLNPPEPPAVPPAPAPEVSVPTPRPAPTPAAADVPMPPEIPADIAERQPTPGSETPPRPQNRFGPPRASSTPVEPKPNQDPNRRVINDPEGDPVVVVPLPE